MATKTITLDPGQSGEVAFSFVPDVAKVYAVSINGLSGSFQAIAVSLQTLWGQITVATGAAIPNALIQVGIVASGYTDSEGKYSIDVPAGVYDVTISAEGYETHTENISVIPGDANRDGMVNMGDVTVVESIILGLDPPTPSADANQDGVINMGDITKIERIILGLDTYLTTIMYNVNLTPVGPEIFRFTEIVENHLPESIIGWAEATCPGQGLPQFQYVPPSGYEVVRCVLTNKLGTHGGCPNCIMSEIWCERIS